MRPSFRRSFYWRRSAFFLATLRLISPTDSWTRGLALSLDANAPVLDLGSDSGLAPLISRWVSFRRFCRHHPRTPVFVSVMLLLFAGSIIGPYFAPYPPTETHTADRLQDPSWQYLL